MAVGEQSIEGSPHHKNSSHCLRQNSHNIDTDHHFEKKKGIGSGLESTREPAQPAHQPHR